MRWPGQGRLEARIDELEKRDSSFTDALVQAVTANASGKNTAFPSATSALETCVGLLGRAFAGAEVAGPSHVVDALSPSILRLIGRSLIRKGEVVFHVDVDGGELVLSPASDVDVKGGYKPSEWEYSLTMAGPSTSTTLKKVPASSVLHFQYVHDNETPWRGIGPLQVATLGGRLSAEVAAALADEASGPRGHVLPLPENADSSDVRTQIKKLKGGVAVVENTATMIGDQQFAGDNWSFKHVGGEPNESLVALLQRSTYEIFSACGVNPSLISPGDGAGQRESWRQYLLAVVSPLGRVVQSELRRKLDSRTWY